MAVERRRAPIPYDPRPFSQKLGMAFQSRVPLLLGALVLLAVPCLVAFDGLTSHDSAAMLAVVPMAAVVAAWRARSAFKILGWVLVAWAVLAVLRAARLYPGAFGLVPSRTASAAADLHAVALGTLWLAVLCLIAAAATWAMRAARESRDGAAGNPAVVFFLGAGELPVADCVVAAACGVLASALLSPASTPAGLFGTAGAVAIGAYAAARFGAVGALAYAGGMGFVSVFAAAMFDARSPLHELAAPMLFVAASTALLTWFDMGFIALTYVGRQRRFAADQAARAAATGIVPE